jgi:hypothetical protein
MGKKKETPEEMVSRIVNSAFQARDERASQAKKAKEDPLGALEDVVRRVFNEEYDKRIKADDDEEEPPKGDDSGGFFARIVGGGS